MNLTRDNYHEFIIVADNSCWIWTLGGSTVGYGAVYFNKKSQTAHRAFYQLFKGEIPKGLHIDHLCSVRRCVNPDHLRAVTIAENVLASHSQSLTAIQARQTHCKNGHELKEPLCRISKHGYRSCRACARSYMAARRAKAGLCKKRRCKLCVDDILEIRNRKRAGENRVELAKEFGVHPHTITKIVSGGTWKHLPL